MQVAPYVIDYIKQALAGDKLTPPKRVANDSHREVLASLYQAYQLGGAVAVKQAWSVITYARPELQVIAYMLDAQQQGGKQRYIPSGLLIPLDELGDLPLPPYAIPRYPIYEQGSNLLYGMPGLGKSFIALDFMGHVAASQPDKTIIYVAPRAVLMPARWKAWTQTYGMNPDNIMIMRQSLRVTDSSLIEQFKTEVEMLDLDVHFIVFDTLARAMVGDNENDTREMNIFMNALDSLRDELECGILLIHHVNKLGAMRGSTVIDGGLDSIIKIERTGDQRITLHNKQEQGGKNRHRAEEEPLHMRLRSVEIEMNKQREQAGVVELVDDAAPTDEPLDQRQRDMLAALDGSIEPLTVRALQTTTGISQSTLYRHLKSLTAAGYIAHDKLKSIVTITDTGRAAYST
ncbi:MAG: AAA family ATPase [Blastochloris sp.]|nr:AAA family ATPase [Blastochloris sp.]